MSDDNVTLQLNEDDLQTPDEAGFGNDLDNYMIENNNDKTINTNKETNRLTK